MGYVFDDGCCHHGPVYQSVPCLPAATEPADGLPETKSEPTVCVVCGITLPDDAAAREHLGTALTNERIAAARLRSEPVGPAAGEGGDGG